VAGSSAGVAGVLGGGGLGVYTYSSGSRASSPALVDYPPPPPHLSREGGGGGGGGGERAGGRGGGGGDENYNPAPTPVALAFPGSGKPPRGGVPIFSEQARGECYLLVACLLLRVPFRYLVLFA